jgi:hypothetical protein
MSRSRPSLLTVQEAALRAVMSADAMIMHERARRNECFCTTGAVLSPDDFGRENQRPTSSPFDPDEPYARGI